MASQWVADVGAFQGTYSVLAVHAVGASGRVFAFEPFPQSRTLLVKNLKLNRMQHRAEVVAAAVGDTERTGTLYTAGARHENSLLPAALPADVIPDALQIRIVTLDGFFAERGRDPDVVKIDVEGAEFQVLRGAERIVRTPCTILCEFHPYAWRQAGHDGEALLAWLAERGRVSVDLRTGLLTTTPAYGVYELRRVNGE
jgi:FkbM family methyltransferase